MSDEPRCGKHDVVVKEVEILNEKMDRKKEKMDDLSTRVRQLEIDAARKDEQVENILEKIDGLMDSIQQWMDFVQTFFWKALGLAGSIILFMAGFIFWYIKTLPRGTGL